jgi:hypothetical protein
MFESKRIILFNLRFVNSTKVNKTLTHDYKMAIIYLLVHEPTKSE